MVTITKTAAPVITLSGKGKAAREIAYMQIAPFSFRENSSRVDTIANLKLALGLSPTDEQLAVAQTEWIIGRVAVRLPAGELFKGTKDDMGRLEDARALVKHFATPAKEGSKPSKLKPHQLGRRSAIQQRVFMNAIEAWSQVKAELGLVKVDGTPQTTARTQATRDKAKRNSAGKRVVSADAPLTGAQLVKGASADMTLPERLQHIVTQATSLMMLCKKEAKDTPTDFAMACNVFHRDIVKAFAAYKARKDVVA